MSLFFFFCIKIMHAFAFVTTVPCLRRHSCPLSAMTLILISVLKLTYVIAKIKSKSCAGGLLLDVCGVPEALYSSHQWLCSDSSCSTRYCNVVMTDLQSTDGNIAR